MKRIMDTKGPENLWNGQSQHFNGSNIKVECQENKNYDKYLQSTITKINVKRVEHKHHVDTFVPAKIIDGKREYSRRWKT